MDDDLSNQIRDLSGDIPEPRLNLSEQQKSEIIKIVGGPKTAAKIVQAKSDFPIKRIPFLFSSLDTQAVVDILANDMQAAILKETGSPD